MIAFLSLKFLLYSKCYYFCKLADDRFSIELSILISSLMFNIFLRRVFLYSLLFACYWTTLSFSFSFYFSLSFAFSFYFYFYFYFVLDFYFSSIPSLYLISYGSEFSILTSLNSLLFFFFFIRDLIFGIGDFILILLYLLLELLSIWTILSYSIHRLQNFENPFQETNTSDFPFFILLYKI